MSHTPGPWTTIERDGDAGISVIGANHYDVALVKQLIGVNAEQYTANAKLIAAAPELLAACIAAEKQAKRWHEREWQAMAELLRDAIANAT